MKKNYKKKVAKKKTRPINKIIKNNDKYLPEIIEKRFNILIFLIVILFVIIGGRLFYIHVLENDTYKEKLISMSQKVIESSSAPRGRIYDRNYKLLVDNEGIKTIYYKKPNDVTTEQEINLAYTIAKNLKINYSKVNDTRLKNFYYKSHYEECRKKITEEEWKLYSERKLNDDDIIEIF